MAYLPTLLLSGVFSAGLGALAAALGSFLTDGYFIGIYETEKRNIIRQHLKNMEVDDIPGMLTHLYRAQDYFTRSQKVEVFEGMVNSGHICNKCSFRVFLQIPPTIGYCQILDRKSTLHRPVRFLVNRTSASPEMLNESLTMTHGA